MPTHWNTVGKVKNTKLYNFHLIRLFHSLHSIRPSLSTVKRKQITVKRVEPQSHDIVPCATISVDTDGAHGIPPTQALSMLRSSSWSTEVGGSHRSNWKESDWSISQGVSGTRKVGRRLFDKTPGGSKTLCSDSPRSSCYSCDEAGERWDWEDGAVGSDCPGKRTNRVVCWNGGGAKSEQQGPDLCGFDKTQERVCLVRHPLAAVEQILAQLGGAKVFTKLYANSGF